MKIKLGGLMLYIEYEQYKRRYHQVQNQYDELLTKKENLIARKKPTDEVNAKLDELWLLLNDRKNLLILKEDELRKSKDSEDIIYRMKYIDKASVQNIRFVVHYCETEVYRKLGKINKNLKNI